MINIEQKDDSIVGSVDGTEIISIKKYDGVKWSVGMSSCLPTDIILASERAQCAKWCFDRVALLTEAEKVKSDTENTIFDLMFHGCQSLTTSKAVKLLEKIKAGKIRNIKYTE